MGRNRRKGKRVPTAYGSQPGNSSGATAQMDAPPKIAMSNDRFLKYYKGQPILPEDEWDAFLEALRQPLPTTFRVASNRQMSRELNDTIQNVYVPSLASASYLGEAVSPPAQIPWYPDGLAWQVSISKKILRRSPAFKEFHSFLVSETDIGNISRQEAVSMIPPLFLEVEPHHVVIDMCAAPGSKTAQLLEALHSEDNGTSISVPPGLLIANDSDPKRTHLLIHQSARMPSPAFAVTNLDASIYPVIRIPAQGSQKLDQLLFDRILCDVPCSGDGTLRKNPNIWKTWQPMDGNGLHSLQLRILTRAMKMLKTDGRIVYSTCSMNPVENEAVVAAALKANQEFELVDVCEKLPELKRRPGLTSWRPTVGRQIMTFSSYQEFIESLNGANLTHPQSTMTKGHWPPPDAVDLGLARCIRIYPHLQDTGAFFIAVLQKKHRIQRLDDEMMPSGKRLAEDFAEFPHSKRLKPGSPPEDTGNAVNMDLAVGGSDGFSIASISEQPAPLVSEPRCRRDEPSETSIPFKENPFTYLSPEDPVLQSCIKEFHLTATFHSFNVLVRNPAGNAVRSLYVTNGLVKTVIQHNDYNRIRLTACGTKVFTKQDGGKGTESHFRVLAEGLPVVLPHMNPDAIIEVDVDALTTFLKTQYPLCVSFKEPVKTLLANKAMGCHIIRYPLINHGNTTAQNLFFPIWKSNVSVSMMIDKKAKRALRLRLSPSGTMSEQVDSTVVEAEGTQSDSDDIGS